MATQIKTDAQFHRAAAPGSLDTNEDVLRSYVASCIGRMEIAAPAKVLRYDRLRHEAVVQPLVKLVGGREGDELERSPVVVSVMRHFSGGYLIDLPLEEGDTGWIVSADDDATLVKRTQDVSLPETLGHHRFAYGYFVADKWNQFALRKEDVDANAAVIQNADASRRIAISEEAVKITATTEKIVQKTPEELAAESEERYNTGEDTVPEDAPEYEEPETEDGEEHSDSNITVTPERVDHDAPLTSVSDAIRVYRRFIEDGASDTQPTSPAPTTPEGLEGPPHRVDIVPGEIASEILPEDEPLPLQDLRIRETRVVSIVGEENAQTGAIAPDGTATASPVQAVVGEPYGTVPSGQAVRLPVFDKTASSPKEVWDAQPENAKKPLVPVFKDDEGNHFPAPVAAAMEAGTAKGDMLYWNPRADNELTGEGQGRWNLIKTDIADASLGQVLYWNGTKWKLSTALGSAGQFLFWKPDANGNHNNAELVPAAAPQSTGQFLYWNATSGAWTLITAPSTSGQILYWDNADKAWKLFTPTNNALFYWNGSQWATISPSDSGKYLKATGSGWVLDTPSGGGGSLPSSQSGYYLVCDGGTNWSGRKFPIPNGESTTDIGKILVWDGTKWVVDDAPSGLPTPSEQSHEYYLRWVPTSGSVSGHWEPAQTTTQEVVVSVSYGLQSHRLEMVKKTLTVLATGSQTTDTITTAVPHSGTMDIDGGTA